jgi:3-deoxy-D-manno-octulosonic-acid transferase
MKTATDTLDIDWLNQFKSDSNLIIIGSLRPADLPLLELLLQADLTSYKVLIAPHDMDDKIIEVVSKYKENIVRYTSMVTGELENANIFILDTMGWLSRCYKYADIAYVGGGFDDSIHNILEPAVFGIPVFFGPRHKKNPEALELLDLIPDLSSTDYNEILKSIEKRISDEELRKKEGGEIKSWIMRNSGATPIILKGLNKIASAISSQTF